MIVKSKLCSCGCGKMGKIWSKGMLKQCFFRLNPPKSAKKVQKALKKSWFSKKPIPNTIKLKEKKKEYIEKQFAMFLEIWEENLHICQSCNKYLGEEPLSLYFDHLLEKSKYKQFALDKRNIYICCGDCHCAKTGGFPSENHKKAIRKAEYLLLYNIDLLSKEEIIDKFG